MKKLIVLISTLSMMLAPLGVLAQKFTNVALGNAALLVVNPKVVYTSGYTKITYPNGDVDPLKGVCTDVIIRAYRKLGVDLQQLVHEDMSANFDLYPSKRIWGLKGTDKNIDHRRVPNLEVFFTRNGKKLPVSQKASDYKAGDIVTWKLGGKIDHIGMVANKKSPDGKRLMIVHNVGGGQLLEDCLFLYQLNGHYSYLKINP